MVKVYLLKTYLHLRNGSRLLAYALETDTRVFLDDKHIIMMDCSDPDIKVRLIDIFRRDYGTVHEFDKEYYVTSNRGYYQSELHMIDTIYREVTKCRIDR